MCPDKELLSAYCDGEVPSPWKQRLDSHVRNCSSCQEIVGRYRTIGSILREQVQPELDIPAAFARVREKVFAAPRPSLWKKRISLPLAAAAAAVIIIFGGGMGLTFFARSAIGVPFAAERRARRADTMANIKDMNQLREILEEHESAQDIMIVLPDLQRFESRGKPVFLREADIAGAPEEWEMRTAHAGGDERQ
ncbi:MAG: zf-HC2 domain-containing protein [Spirochaetales bacterium]|jgi:hypothetical protein|nr:zf-HC2 domain-containing protein [Spirochaetales bacterium]